MDLARWLSLADSSSQEEGQPVYEEDGTNSDEVDDIDAETGGQANTAQSRLTMVLSLDRSISSEASALSPTGSLGSESFTEAGSTEVATVDVFAPTSGSVESSLGSEEDSMEAVIQRVVQGHPETAVAVEETRQQRKTQKQKEKSTKKEHIRWFGHGKLWTVFALVASWIGVILAILSRRSIEFVQLKEPLLFAPIYDPVNALGMVRMELCYNETAAGRAGCEIIKLSAGDVDDNMFELARIFLTLGTFFGFFFSLFLSSAVFWETINLKPIGFGFLITYFFQSFSMLFFDTQLCSENKCQIGSGCILTIVASLGWIASCVATAKMDAYKLRDRRRRRRLARRKARQARRERREKRAKQCKKKSSTLTERTKSTSGSDSGHESVDLEQGGDYDQKRADGTYEC